MTENNEYAVECEGLGRVYRSRSLLGQSRETVALQDLNLQIPKGTVFGVLGPNGAGKTTTIRILSTLLSATTGTARVLGYDVVKEGREVRKNIGIILGGDRGFYGRLTGKENLRYFAALNHIKPRDTDRIIDDSLAQAGLADQQKTLVEQYSRGMKQRLHVARGLLTDPGVVFMDEPTLGLDPLGAQELRQRIPALVGQGKTVLLTTHYMFEADSLCSRIAIINKGKLVALGTPAEIKRNFSSIGVIELTLNQTRPSLQEELTGLDGVKRATTSADGVYQKLTVHVVAGADLSDKIAEVVGKDHIENMVARDPTLEEAYLEIID
ncbi:MAG: ABC transporter ATP-binding protein [Chloroflexi bacterium]|nr:ABC transporter ATP-binding protein [Chloroflexota bacterium]